jgi:hypothetical protein
VLRRLGRRDPAAFVERHLSAAAIARQAQQGLGIVQGKVAAVLAGMERFGRRWRIDRLVAAAQRFRAEFAELMAGVQRGARQATQTLGDRVTAMTRRGDSDTRARGTTGGTVRAQPAASDPPGGGGSGGGDPTSGKGGRGASPSRTTPTGQSGASPTGRPTRVGPSEDASVRRSLTRENESAQTLAAAGYRVEQNPPRLPNGARPDYRIEGEYFDCYAPAGGTSATNVRRTLEGKAARQQAERFVVNADDWNGDVGDLAREIRSAQAGGIREVIVVRGGRVVQAYP